jgi:hypothetical protein
MPRVRVRNVTVHERGMALIVVMLVMMVLSALGMSLALVTSTERQVTATYRDGMAALYAADAAIERVLPDLASLDVNNPLTGTETSSFIDGPPGQRRLPDATVIDLHDLTSPPWQLYGHGSLPTASTTLAPTMYAVVWLADDPFDTDGRLSLMAHAYGPRGARRVIEATVLKTDHGVEMLSWRETR